MLLVVVFLVLFAWTQLFCQAWPTSFLFLFLFLFLCEISNGTQRQAVLLAVASAGGCGWLVGFVLLL